MSKFALHLKVQVEFAVSAEQLNNPNGEREAVRQLLLDKLKNDDWHGCLRNIGGKFTYTCTHITGG